MKRLPSILAVCLTAIPISCAPMSNNNAKPTAAVGGALLGAAAGGIIGHQSGHTAEGATIGAAAGGAYGWQNGVKLQGGDGSIQNVERGN